MYRPLPHHYPPPRRSFLSDHPGLSAAGIAFGILIVMALWKATLVIIVLAGVGFGLWHLTRWLDRKHLEKVRVRQALIARAECEHRLLMAGDLHAIYGQYPPAM